MDDREVIRAFVVESARQGFGPAVHIERDALLVDGWWHAAFRVSPDAFIVRSDEPPVATDALADLAAELTGRGLANVGDDFPLVAALTYAELSLAGGVDWELWAADRASGEAALAARISAESFLPETATDEPAEAEAAPEVQDLSAELEGTRRMVGLPATVVVAVGVDSSRLAQLRMGMPECRFESLELETALDACGLLRPALILVDATDRVGQELIMHLRADACGRFIPVVALTHHELPLGADLALEPDQDPLSWVEPLRRLLPDPPLPST
ncbi:MAG: hypothetical protein M3N31_07575 [Actinomycetota bacterium]|nr:hypothetical protein [Actinomycetota bacterium]